MTQCFGLINYNIIYSLMAEDVCEANYRDGARVVRGRDWKWQDQDGNGLGTLDFKNSGSSFWVHVKWDNGRIGHYRAGPEFFDLKMASSGATPGILGSHEARSIGLM